VAVIPVTCEIKVGGSWSTLPWAKKHETLSKKNKIKIKQKLAGGVAQVVDCLPSQGMALSSNPSAAKEKKKKARCWWLTLIILATWEAEIRTIMTITVRGQPRQMVQEAPSPN
jgi:hypothetical protein